MPLALIAPNPPVAVLIFLGCLAEIGLLWLIAKVLQQFALAQKGNAIITRFLWMSDKIRHTIFVCVQ